MINIKRLFFVFAFLTCFFSSTYINAQKINQFDENNKRTGIWQKEYPNKSIRYKGQFLNGKEVGVFKFYDQSSSKQPTTVKTFYKDSDSLFVQFYTIKGKIASEGMMKGRERVGKWKYFYPKGTLMSEENYKNGKLNGEQFIYYENGKITESAYYKNGLKDGIIRKFSKDGILLEEMTFLNGKANGVSKYFELNGKLKESGSYKDGKRVGKWLFYKDGKVVADKEQKKIYTLKKGR
ncbi:toxin-antitoxin system YwqK family antitoxin [uncultured Polaribacter sp.]|uniref:toxin-antitoxin system YwqK family antitoxin n=1 Tax=uncultured Polaribacter sp. TaxID=174711 RepID=UPI002613D337|nr:toxin-antitoxin system YwqK family antitoxin [uncultured Polaribacter sp.]